MSPPRKRAELDRLAREQVAELGPHPTHERATVDPHKGHTGPTPIRKVRIPADQWAALEQYAQRHGISTSAALRVALGEFLRGGPR